MAEKKGNMFYRGDWKVCFEYDVGDVVQRAGALYMAMDQSAGMDPMDPLNARYWKLTFAPIVPPATKHNELEELQGGSGAERYHLTKNQAEAAMHALRPGASNPFLTQEQVPELEKRVTDFRLEPKPDGVGQLYGAAFGSDVFVGVGDNSCVVGLDAGHLKKRTCPAGFWRGVAFGGGVFAAVGLGGKAMFSEDRGETWSEAVAPVGDWNAVTHGNGMFVAVTDGKIMKSLDGKTLWTGKIVPVGYGLSVTFGNGVFVAIGSKGALTSSDGENWTVRNTPHASWRTGDYGDGKFLALGGKCMVSEDDGANWAFGNALPSGGWDAVKYGGGFFVAVGGGYSCMVSPSGALNFELRDVPNFVWSDLAFGLDTFVAVGSGIMAAKIVDVAAGLNAANAPSSTNSFATTSDVQVVNEKVTALVEDLKWKGVI